MLNILVVHADLHMSEQLRTAVRRRWPWVDVQAAASGTQALEVVRHWPVTAAVIDQDLKGEEGLDVCQRLRQYTQAPLVLLVAGLDPALHQRALRYGVNALVVKPFRVREVVATLEPFLRAAVSRSMSGGQD